MKKTKDPQPAKKSYFFGPGYSDLFRAIKLAWEENAKKAKRYHTQFSQHGLMSFTGIIKLFCSLSVVTFGTLFFCIISAIMLTVLTLFFVAVYIGFAVVWTIDRVHLIRKKIFAACGECKTGSLVPYYICPTCNAMHTKLVPSSYGILKRECNCGTKLPTTFFNGRKKLSALCPECYRQGKRTPLYDRESRPLCVPVVGGRSCGKTAFITAFSRQFIDQIAPQAGIEIEIYSSEKNAIYSEICSDYASGSTRMTPRSEDVTKASSISFSFFAKHRRLKPERLVHIYDIAGEVFTDNHENEIQKQYEYCHGIVLMIDPLSISSVRAQYEDGLLPQDRASMSQADINGVFDVFINKLREVTGLSDKKMYKVPVAVVLSKMDAIGMLDAMEDPTALSQYGTQDPADCMDYQCRKFLRDNGMAAFVQAIDMRFATNRFFAVSAIGHARDTGAYQPRNVMLPMEWICGKADRKFSGIWAKTVFPNKPFRPEDK